MPSISDLFVDPKELPDNFGGFVQLLFLMACYAFFLYQGSHFISDGSELLLLIPSIAGIVGSVVLPVLGAVPDGAIVLFSGLGPDAQQQLNIGVGALAGSSVMLITLPWAMCILAGRVDLDKNGNPQYKKPAGAPKGWSKLTPNAGLYHTLFKSGIVINKPMKTNAVILMLTAIAYLLIQIPAFAFGCGKGQDCERGHSEKWWAFIGLVYAGICFVAYLVYQVRVGGETEHYQEKMTQMVGDQVSNGRASVAAAFFAFVSEAEAELNAINNNEKGSTRALLSHAHTPGGSGPIDKSSPNEISVGISTQNATALSKFHPSLRAEKRFKHLLRRFFKKYDRDGNGVIDVSELGYLMADIGCHLSQAAVNELFGQMDIDHDSAVDLNEFCEAVVRIVEHPDLIKQLEEKYKTSNDDNSKQARLERKRTIAASRSGSTLNLASPSGSGPMLTTPTNASGSSDVPSSLVMQPIRAVNNDSAIAVSDEGEGEDESDIEEDESEEVPDDLRDLTREQQQRAIKLRAAWMMSLGVFIIILFSDPMCDCLAELGERVHVPGFYVAFLLAPLAANASELMAAVNYATKKTPSSITISITSLEGSGTMNNTFCLLIFLVLIFAKDLLWQFSAETISILVVELVVSLMALKKVHRGIDAIIILSLYPLAMGLVAILENAVGLN